MEKYNVVRYYYDGTRREVVKRGLTLEQAQAHCRNPETSSRTCQKPKNVARTKAEGPWFDGYVKQ